MKTPPHLFPCVTSGISVSVSRRAASGFIDQSCFHAVISLIGNKQVVIYARIDEFRGSFVKNSRILLFICMKHA